MEQIDPVSEQYSVSYYDTPNGIIHSAKPSFAGKKHISSLLRTSLVFIMMLALILLSVNEASAQKVSKSSGLLSSSSTWTDLVAGTGDIVVSIGSVDGTNSSSGSVTAGDALFDATGSFIGIVASVPTANTFTLQNGAFKGISSASFRKQGTADATSAPVSGEIIVIMNGNTVTVDLPFTCNASIINNGILTVSSTLTFGLSSSYIHYSDGGVIPAAAWNSGSECILAGIRSTAPTGLNQTFGNLTVNAGELSAPLTLSPGGDVTIQGNLSLAGTSATNTITFDPAAYNFTVNGTTSVGNYSLLSDNGDAGLTRFDKLLTVEPGGQFVNSGNPVFEFRGGILNNGIFNKTGTGSTTFSTNALQPVSGSAAISLTGDIYITGAASLTVACDINWSGTTFQISGTAVNPWVASSGTFTFTGGVQSVSNIAGTGPVTFYDLVAGGTLTKTIHKNFTVTRNLTVSNLVTLSLGNFSTTGEILGNLTVDGILDFGTLNPKVLNLSGDLINISGTITMNSDAGRAHVLNLGGAANSISALNTAGALSTIAYVRSGNQEVFASAAYQNLTISGSATKALQGSSTVSNVLSLSGGILQLGASNLTLTNNTAGAITGSFSGSDMIETNSSGAVIRNAAAALPLLFPVGSGGYYSPVVIDAISGGTTGTIRVAAVNDPSAPSNYLNRYWDITTSTAGKTITATFTYDPAEVSYPPSNIWYKPGSGDWLVPSGTAGFGTNSFTITGTTNITNTSTWWTASSSVTFYSYQTGDWLTPNTWTTDPSGTLQIGNSVPQSNDKVVILSGRTVSLAEDISAGGLDISIEAGAFLNMVDHRFSSSLAALRGEGTLQLASVNFPSAVVNTLVNAGGGTTEYYNASAFNLPAAQAVYNNLVINTNTASATLLHNLILNGSLRVKSGTFRINDNTSAAKLSLTISGNVNVDEGASITVGTGATNTAIGSVTAGGTAPFINYYTSFHTIIVKGDFTNNGTVRFTNLSYPVYNAFPPAVSGAGSGAATVYFQGPADNILTCKGTTDFYNLVVDKGTDQTYKLTVYSDDWKNFRLFGANTLSGEAAGINANLRKALWIRTGTMVLEGSVIIPSLTEGITAGPPNSDYIIPGNGALVLNGTDAVVLSTADDYREVNTAYGVSGPDNASMGITTGGVSALEVYGKLQVSDGFLSTRESGGLITSNVGSGQIIIEGGTVDAKQVISTAGSSAQFNQTGGSLLLRGRFTRKPLDYTTVAGIRDVSLPTLGTVRAANGINSSFGSFNLENTTNIFTMSGGVIRIYDVTGTAVTEKKALDIKSSAANINVTGGSIEIVPVSGSVPADDADYLINTTAPFGNLLINRISGTAAVLLNSNPLIVNGSVTLASGVLNCNNLDLTIKGNFAVYGGTSYVTGSNATIFSGNANQLFTIGLASPLSVYRLTVDKPAGKVLSFDGTQKSVTVSDNLRIVAGTLDDNGNSITVLRNVYNSGIHSGTGKIILAGTSQQVIDGNGIFGNVDLNNTAVSAAPVSLVANMTINGTLTLSNDKLFNIGTYSLKLNGFGSIASSSGSFASRYILTAGNSGDGGVTKTFSAPGAFIFPVGVAGYTPASLTLNGVPSSYGSVTVVPVNFPHPNVTVPGRTLSYFWRTKSTGFNLGSATVSHGYTYSDANVVTGSGVTEDGYVAARFNLASNTWSKGTANDVDENANIIGEPGAGSFLENVGFIDGDYTAGDDLPTSPFGVPVTFYSRINGDASGSGLWSNTSTWSTDPVLKHAGAAASVVPGASDIVIIGGRDSVYLASNNTIPNTDARSCASLQVEKGSALDVGFNPGSNFGMVLTHPNGNGNIRVACSYDSGSTYQFPSGDFSDFNINVGTTELYTTNPEYGTTYWLPNGVLSYGNLILSPLGGSNIIFPNHDLTLYGNLVTRGQNTDSWFCPTWDTDYPTAPALRVAKTITIKGDLLLQGGSLIWVGNENTAENVVVNGDVVVGTYSGIGTWNNSSFNQQLSIGGSLINNSNGLLNPPAYQITAQCDFSVIPVTFFGPENASITNTGGNPSIIFSKLTVNKGTSQATSLTIDMAGTITSPADNWLTLLNGTIRYVRNNPNSDFTISTVTPFTIPSTAGLYVNLPSNSSNRNILIGNSADSNGDLLLGGKLTLVNGNVYIGPVTGSSPSDNDIEYTGSSLSSIDMQGGRLMVNGQVRRPAGTTNGAINYSQSGGTVIINGNNFLPSKAKFEVLNPGSSFNMSGGTLTIVRGGGTTFGDLYLRPATGSVTGGTIIFSQVPSGSAIADATQSYLLDANLPLYNLTITGKSAAVARDANVGLMVSPLVLDGTLTLGNSNSILTSNNIGLTIKGDLINNGTYNYGTNNTIFGGGFQTISGTSETDFHDLTVNSVNSLTTSGSFIVGRNLNVSTGNLVLGANKLTLLGDVINEGSVTDINSNSGLILAGSSAQQQITGSGAFGRIELNNASGARANSDISLQGDLQMTQGILDIGKYQFTLSQNSIIGGAPFSVTKMIKSDGVISGIGLVKFFKAEAQTFTFPVGVTGKYTPASLNILASAEVGSIGINPINNRHSSISDPANALAYYWQIRSSGITDFYGDIHLQYIPGDVVGTESEYVASKLALPGSYWYEAPAGAATDNVDESLHQILFTSSAVNNVTGDYTAGKGAAFPEEVSSYISVKDGNWSDKTVWAPVGSSPPCPDGGPYGANVIIDHVVTADVNNIYALSTTINNRLIVDPANFSHNLGVVDGDGTIYLLGGNLPGGNYDAFTDCSGNGTVEYGGSGTYTIIASLYKSLPNMLITGTGTRILPNKELTICKRLVIDGPVLDNSVNNSRLILLGTFERYNTGRFISGSGNSPLATVTFAGTEAQVIGGATGDFSGINKLNNLEVRNPAGLAIGANGLVEVSNQLLLTNGIIHTSATEKLVMLSTSPSTVLPAGGSTESFVDGPLIKYIINGGSFLFPLGHNSLKGHDFSIISSAGSTMPWTVECIIPNPTATSLADPLKASNTREYWKVSTPVPASGKVKIGWDPQSDLTPLMLQNGLADMRVARFINGAWTEVESTASGDLNNGYVVSNTGINVSPAPENFTTASVTIPEARASFGTSKPVCGTAGIPVNFTSFFPIELSYTISYTINGTPQPELTVTSLPFVIPTPIPGSYRLTGFKYNNGTHAGVVDGSVLPVYEVPVVANAGIDRSLCGISGLFLAGNSPVPYTGLWTRVSGPGGTFIDNTQYNTYFTGILGKSYTLRWTIRNQSCTSSDDVVISFPVEAAVPSAFMTAPSQVCRGTGSYVYTVPAVAGNIYTWSYSGTGATITGSGNSVTLSFSSSATSGTLSVTATNDCGTSGARSVAVTVNSLPAAIAGSDKSVCPGTPVTLGTSAVPGSTYLWISSPAGFSSTTADPVVSPVVTTTYTVVETSTVTGCSASNSVTITVIPEPTATISYSGTPFCSSVSTALPVTLTGTGDYTGGTFTAGAGLNIDPLTGSIIPSLSTPGVYTVIYTIPASATCNEITTSASVAVTEAPTVATVASATLDVCNSLVSAGLGGNAPGVGTGHWSQVAGTGTTIFSDASSGSSTATASAYGTYIYKWTISNGSCDPSSATVSVRYYPVASVASASISHCGSLVSTPLGGNNPGPATSVWSQISGPGTTVFSNPASGSSTATVSVYGIYVYEWTLSGGTCPQTSAQVTVEFNPAVTDATVAANPLDYCGTLTTGSLGGNTPAFGTGLWTQISGPGTTVFSDATAGNSTATATAYGTYVYKWSVTAGTCTPGEALLTVNYYEIPTVASVTTATLNYCGSLSSGQLGGNTPAKGTGAWSQVSGPGASVFSSVSSGSSTATASAYGTYVYEWTISNGSCPSSNARVTVLYEKTPDAATVASAALDYCATLTSAPLGGNIPVAGTGAWSLVSGPGTVVFSEASSGSSTATVSTPGSYQFRWTISNGLCTPSSADVTVNFYDAPTTPVIGLSPLNFCGTLETTGLGANTASTGSGQWSQVSGPGTTVFSNATSGSSTALASEYGTYVYRWTISNGTCTPLTADITVNYYETPDIASVSASSLAYCGTLVSAALGGNTPVSGTGNWSQVSGPGTATFSSSSSGASTATVTAYGVYVLRWTVGNGSCTASSADVTVEFTQAPTTASVTASSLNYCGTLTSEPLGGNNPASGTALWSIISGGTGFFSSSSDGNSTFTADSYGTYQLQWTITSGTCSPSSANVTVSFAQNPTTALAGADLTGSDACGLVSVALSGNTPVTGAGEWTIIAGTGGSLSSATDPAAVFNGIPETLYTLRWTITNSFCAPSSDEVNIKFHQKPSAVVVATDIKCNGNPEGAIDVTPLGGLTPYVFEWTGPGVVAASEDQSGLGAGIYNLKLTDANGCVFTESDITISEPPVLILNIDSQTNVSVFGASDGSVTVSAEGGTAPYLYRIGSQPFSATATFGPLAAGDYTVTVQDQNLCTKSVIVSITQPNLTLSGSIVSTTNVACFGTSTGSVTVTGEGGVKPYEYRLDDGNFQSSGTFGGLAAGTYNITVRDSEYSAADLTVTITEPLDAVVITGIEKTDVVCYGSSTGSLKVSASGGTAPYSYQLGNGELQSSAEFASLHAGDYVVNVIDANLCIATVPVTVTQPEDAVKGTVDGQTNIGCNGASNGSVTVSGSGGEGPYTYSIGGGAFQDSGSFSSLTAGSYSVTIKDSAGCTGTVNIEITEPAVLEISHTEEPASCPGEKDGSITLNITGGTQPYSAIWSDGISGLSRNDVTNETYSVVVTDKNGCAKSAVIEVGVTGSQNCLEIPDVITPNNDGVNDTWKLKNIDLFPKAEVYVYNRWGEKVFSSRNIAGEPWDGTYKGKLQPTDSYHYVLYLHDGSEPRSGVISIIR